MPSRTPVARAAPDGRLSRPTATRGGLPVRSRSQANVVYACPTARAAAGVSCSSTSPRMSYWRKIVAGSFTDTPCAGPLGWGCGGCRRGLHAVSCGSREIEQPVRPDAEEQQADDDHCDRGPPPPVETDIYMGVFDRLRFHIHRHDDGKIVPRRDDAGQHENDGQGVLARAGGGDEDVPLADEAGRPGKAEQREHAHRECEGEPGTLARESREAATRRRP